MDDRMCQLWLFGCAELIYLDEAAPHIIGRSEIVGMQDVFTMRNLLY
jgi:hypothetical protein